MMYYYNADSSHLDRDTLSAHLTSSQLLQDDADPLLSSVSTALLSSLHCAPIISSENHTNQFDCRDTVENDQCSFLGDYSLDNIFTPLETIDSGAAVSADFHKTTEPMPLITFATDGDSKEAIVNNAGHYGETVAAYDVSCETNPTLEISNLVSILPTAVTPRIYSPGSIITSAHINQRSCVVVSNRNINTKHKLWSETPVKRKRIRILSAEERVRLESIEAQRTKEKLTTYIAETAKLSQEAVRKRNAAPTDSYGNFSAKNKALKFMQCNPPKDPMNAAPKVVFARAFPYNLDNYFSGPTVLKNGLSDIDSRVTETNREDVVFNKGLPKMSDAMCRGLHLLKVLHVFESLALAFRSRVTPGLESLIKNLKCMTNHMVECFMGQSCYGAITMYAYGRTTDPQTNQLIHTISSVRGVGINAILAGLYTEQTKNNITRRVLATHCLHNDGSLKYLNTTTDAFDPKATGCLLLPNGSLMVSDELLKLQSYILTSAKSQSFVPSYRPSYLSTPL